MAQNNKDAYLAVIEFNKTIVSITSTVLAALITFIVFQDYGLGFKNIIAPVVLVISLIFSLRGIGRAIPAIRLDQSKIWAVRYSNIGAFLMILGILLIGLIQKPEKPTMDITLSNIEKSLNKIYPLVEAKNCLTVQLENDEYVFHFQKDTLKRKVVYSIEKDKITATEIE
ncbi:hypothetical protein GCM10009120_31690 [Sphingobacterium siyangense subsp. cladoniae]|uniref:hypothetical protein n=1 Tax=Sphingobacterium siyangense TaxID=459529 RepID=UPI0031F9C5E1